MSRAEKPVCGFNDGNFPASFGGQRFQLHALLREELRNLRCSENSRRPMPRPWRDCLLIEKGAGANVASACRRWFQLCGICGRRVRAAARGISDLPGLSNRRENRRIGNCTSHSHLPPADAAITLRSSHHES